MDREGDEAEDRGPTSMSGVGEEEGWPLRWTESEQSERLEENQEKTVPWKTGGRDLSRWVKWSLEALRGLWSHRFVRGHDLSSPKTLLLWDPLVTPTNHTGKV